MPFRLALAWAFSAAVAVAQSSFSVSPQQVSLAAPFASTTPAVQRVTVLSNEPNLQFNAAVRYLGSTTGWLSVSPMTGTAPADLTISANPSGLPAGTYLGQVTITAGRFGAVVDVLFTVQAGAPLGNFTVSPSSLTFFGQLGQDILPSQTVSVATRTGEPAGFTAVASSSGNWLSVSPPSGTTPATLTVGAIQSALGAGTYNGTITLTPTAGGNPTVVPVTLVASGSGTVAPVLVFSQSLLKFNYEVPLTTPPATPEQRVTVAAGDEFLVWTATTTTSWLRLKGDLDTEFSNVARGFTSTDLTVQVNPLGLGMLSPPEKDGAITISADPPVVPQSLPVKLTIISSSALNADPSSVVFRYLTGGTLPDSQNIIVTATGNANLSFTATTSASWLKVTPLSASTATDSQNLTLTASPVGLNPGTYQASLTLMVQSTTTVPSSSFVIPVTLIVTSGATPSELEIFPESLELTGLIGGANPSRQINVTGPGLNQNFTVSAKSDGGWLTVSPFSGSTPSIVTVSANSTAVSAGTHEGSVIVTSLVTGVQTEIPVTFTLTARAIMATPDTLRFVQPSSGATPPPQTVEITANIPSTFVVTQVPSGLRVTPDRGSTPATLTVSWVTVSALPPGTNGSSIVVTGPDNRISIPVSLVPPEAPKPTIAPESITLAYQIGSPAPAAQSIQIGSTTEPISFTARAATESGAAWLSIAPTSGVTPATLSATINPALLVPGEQKGTITLLATDGTTVIGTIPVVVNVRAAPAAILGILHGATFAPTPVAPGLIVTITGSGLGPATGVTARPTAAGAIETRLADTRVLFDGVPAPVLYVRNDQINAIVPYALHGRLSARVQAEVGGSLSLPIEVKVVDSVPGVFTSNGTGRGQVAAVNNDTTANSPANAAQRGTVISIFGTGDGQTDPAGQDGRIITTDLRRTVLPVTVRIGGRPAEVLYSGSAATLVSGIFQMNIRIPEDAPTGTVPLEIQVGSAVSQTGITIAVR